MSLVHEGTVRVVSARSWLHGLWLQLLPSDNTCSSLNYPCSSAFRSWNISKLIPRVWKHHRETVKMTWSSPLNSHEGRKFWDQELQRQSKGTHQKVADAGSHAGPGLFPLLQDTHPWVRLIPLPPTMFHLVLTGEHDPNSDGAIWRHWHGVPTHGDVRGSWVLCRKVRRGHRFGCRTDGQLAGLPLPNAEGYLCHGRRWAPLQVRAMLTAFILLFHACPGRLSPIFPVIWTMELIIYLGKELEWK